MRPALKPTIIAAVAKNGVIGDSQTNRLPWRGKYIDDLRLFRATMRGPEGRGSIVIMGRNTFEEISDAIGGPIPRCDNIVLSTKMERRRDLFVARDMTMAFVEAAKFVQARPDNRVYIIGGGSVYRQTIEFDFVEWMLISHLNGEHQGDISFPSINPAIWRKSEQPVRRYDDFEQFLYTRMSKHG